jgi:hypothetical protein
MFAQAPFQTFFPVQPNVNVGGRTVSLAVGWYSSFAASESGGLFVSKNGSTNWAHVESLPPFRLSDVKIASDGVPGTEVVIVTAYGDTRSINSGGIWLSADGGTHWNKPPTSNPTSTASPCPRANAYGIAVEAHSKNIYVATDCGLAVSNDVGQTWRYVTAPKNPNSSSDRISAIVAQNGIVDMCGDNGHYRWIPANMQNPWTPFSTALPGCPVAAAHAIAVSPLESNVVFATTANNMLEESDDGGASWLTLNPPAPGYTSRASWVKAHLSTDGNPDHFDLYFGNPTNVAHRTCSRGGNGLRCGTGSWTSSNFDHESGPQCQDHFSAAIS